MYDLKAIIAALSQMKKPNLFLWNLLVKAIKTEDTKRFEVHTRKAKRKITPFVGPNMPGVFLGRDEFSISEFEPPMIKPVRTAHANDIFKQQFGQTVYGDQAPGTSGLRTLTSELVELDDAITRKENIMLAELLTTGKMSIQGKGVSREAISYGTDSENFETLTGTDAWNNTGSDPLSDLGRWQMLVLKKTGILIDSVVLTLKAKDAFMKNEEVIKVLKYTEQNIARVEPRKLGDGASYIGTIPELNIDIYSFVDWYTDDSGTEVELLPDGGVLACRSKSVTVHYGAIGQLVNGVNSIFKGDRIPKHWVDEDADIEKIRLSASPLPVLDDADSIIFADVIEEA
jgi:hypothetical protein